MNVEEFLKNEVNRRQFLGSSAKNAAGVAAGVVGLAGSVGRASPQERVAVGVMGVRSQGKRLAGDLAGFPDVDVAVLCDADENVLPAALSTVEEVQGTAPRSETDFRRVLDDPSVDAVVVATPDHWHAVMTILACQAGKDVYVEKPVSHNVLEGERMTAAARTHGRVVQAGLHQRSGSHFRSAIEYVRGGRLGRVNLARAWIVHRRKPIGIKANAPVPKGVDYDLWLGPAPERPFNPNRFHHNWHWYWDYGTGEIGNWGAHMLDVARWGLGVDWPERVAATGGKYQFRDDRETPDTHIVHYTYPGRTIVWEHRMWSNHGLEGRSAAVAFYGERGTLIVDRGGWKVYDADEPLSRDGSNERIAHYRNFIDCVKSRQTPVAEVETGHVSSALCHLGNVAYRAGREIAFDAATMTCPNDPVATALLGREYRSPWTLPEV